VPIADNGAFSAAEPNIARMDAVRYLAGQGSPVNLAELPA
jgi:hypothetical protein